MRKILLAAMLATFLLSLGATTAAARSGFTTAPESIVAKFSSLEFSASGVIVRCPVILEATFHEFIPKNIGTLAGFADVDVDEPNCRNGSGGLLDLNQRRTTGLVRWHLTYEGFEGELPDAIESVSILIQPLFWVSILGGLITCLSNHNITGTSTGGNPATGLTTSANLVGFNGCSVREATLSGTATLFEEKNGSPAEMEIVLVD